MVRQAHHERRKEFSSRDCSNPVRPDASSSSAVNATLSSHVIVPIPFVLMLRQAQQ
ncbi:MAG TPA: hypothetical protein VKR54_03010 [Candidatus Babeliales bacterium]|nr:hypothetical protein [Candidatus Babeliales bacterium]